MKTLPELASELGIHVQSLRRVIWRGRLAHGRKPGLGRPMVFTDEQAARVRQAVEESRRITWVG